MNVMRTHQAWVHMVSMLALLLGFMPTSVIASLSITSCKMACCVGKPVHKMADPVCLEGCEAAKGHSSKSASSVIKKEDDGCKCSIGSAPSPPQPDIATLTNSGHQIQQVVADIPLERSLAPTFAEPESERGVIGTDSGPPASRPNYVSLGRAPPVLLA